MSHHNSFLQSISDPMSPYNMSLQYFREEQNRASERESDRINERYYKSISSSSKESKRDKILAQNTSVSLALEKRLEEIEKAIYSRPSSSASLIKIIKSYFTGR